MDPLKAICASFPKRRSTVSEYMDDVIKTNIIRELRTENRQLRELVAAMCLANGPITVTRYHLVRAAEAVLTKYANPTDSSVTYSASTERADAEYRAKFDAEVASLKGYPA
jgi:hypothetical protein